MRILIYGLSKTGTTFLSEKVRKSLEKHLDVEVKDIFEPHRFEFIRGELHYKNRVLSVKSQVNEVVKTLFDSGVPPEEVLNHELRFDKKIFIVRDPRDRFISETFYRWHHGHSPDLVKFKQTLRLTKFKEENPKDLPLLFLFSQNPQVFGQKADRLRHIYSSVLSFMRDKGSDWFILRYEDLVDGDLGDLEAYLGFPLSKQASVSAERSRVVRSKSYGNWRQWFTDEDVIFFKPVFREYMESTGYDFSDWELTNPNFLPSSQGSKYLERISSQETEKKDSMPKNRLISKLVEKCRQGLMKLAQSEFRYRIIPKVAPSSPHFFVHIPKTGGTSFRHALELTVGEINIVEDYPNSAGYQNSLVYKHLVISGDRAKFVEELHKKRNAWLIGHTNISKYLDIFDCSKVITFIRHPVDRIVSSYRHRVRHHGLNCSFEEYARSDECSNFQSKKLRGLPLEKIGFVGVTERYSESLLYINWQFSLSLPLMKTNQAPNHDEVYVSPEFYQELCDANVEDLKLYEKANKLLDEKLKIMGNLP